MKKHARTHQELENKPISNADFANLPSLQPPNVPFDFSNNQYNAGYPSQAYAPAVESEAASGYLMELASLTSADRFDQKPSPYY